MAMSVTVGWTRTRPSWKTATGKPRLGAGQVEQALALRRAGFVERRRDRAPLEHVVELRGSPPTIARPRPGRPRSQRVAGRAQRSSSSLMPPKNASSGSAVGATTSLSNWPRTDARTRSLLASGSRPQASAQSTSKPLLAPGAAMSASARTSAPGASDEATAGNDQGRFTSGGRELRQLCQAFGTQWCIRGSRSRCRSGAGARPAPRASRPASASTTRSTDSWDSVWVGLRGSPSMRQPYRNPTRSRASSGVDLAEVQNPSGVQDLPISP